jgi:hypothetical protein
MSVEKLTESEREALEHYSRPLGTCRKALRIIDDQADLFKALLEHLDYCGWGDSWERECSEPLRARAAQWVKENES